MPDSVTDIMKTRDAYTSKNAYKIEVSTASEVGTEKLEQCKKKVLSLQNRQTFSAKKKIVKKLSLT